MQACHFKRFIALNNFEKNLVLQWRNHEEVRKWMVNPTLISYQEHQLFLEGLKSSNKHYFLGYRNKLPVGVLNYEVTGGEDASAYVGMFVDPLKINSGFGVAFSFYSVKFLFNECELNSLLLKTKKENLRILKVSQFLGFQFVRTSETYDISVLKKEDFGKWAKDYESFKRQRVKRFANK